MDQLATVLNNHPDLLTDLPPLHEASKTLENPTFRTFAQTCFFTHHFSPNFPNDSGLILKIFAQGKNVKNIPHEVALLQTSLRIFLGLELININVPERTASTLGTIPLWIAMQYPSQPHNMSKSS